MAGVTAAVTLGAYAPAEESVVEAVSAETPAPMSESDQVAQQFLQASSELWFLLSSINDRTDADRSAERFLKLVHRIFELDEKLSRLSVSSEPQESTVEEPGEVVEVEEVSDAVPVVGMINSSYVRILEAFDDLNAEFTDLCRVRCYGSTRLRTAFRQAVAAGMFNETDLEMLQDPPLPLTEEESRRELVRLRRLVEPNRVLLSTLEQVKDADSARHAVQNLDVLTKRLQQLLPEGGVVHRSFADSSAQSVKEVMQPLEPLLWNIRSEIVRIAALPDYDTAPFDAFSDALDVVFEQLSEVHHAQFEDVFDASFRSDLEDAIQCSRTTLSQ